MTFVSYATGLDWIARLSGLAILVQTLELLSIRDCFSDSGVWRWKDIREDFRILGRPLCSVLDVLLDYQVFLVLLLIRAIAAFLVLLHPHVLPIAILSISTILISLRWRGSWNGGSDFMNLIVLNALLLAFIFKESASIGRACLWYIAVQTCTSYFLGGIIKLRQSEWRSGRALPIFLENAIYVRSPLSAALSSPTVSLLASWSVIVFECTFPLVLIMPEARLVFLALGLIFHLGNCYFFGLNGFLFSWTATYPAILFFTSKLP